ncbi:glycoside hydrolase family 79 protein [Xylariaceae sp. FL0016]|nr:glycoside hydrolase family 79 protein [Xylariaceae sp. FL0016]
MAACLCKAVAAASLLRTALAADALSFSVNDSPKNASAAISPSFAGLGVEPSQLFSFMGGSNKNELTTTLLANLANFTGQPPHIRLGGNTQDYMLYNESQTAWSTKANTDPVAVGKNKLTADNMIIGPRFFEAANRLPQGSPVTWGLNLAYNEDDYIDQIVTMAQQVVNRCDNINIVSFEIGNEPDIYVDHAFRNKSTWSGSVYTDEWTTRAAAIYEQVLKPQDKGTNFFDSAATTAWVAGTTFEIEMLAADGISAQADGSSNPYLASWDQHNYFYFLDSGTDYALTLDYMMQLDTTESQFNEALGQQLTQAKATDFPWALREMNSVGPLGMEGISDTFGAAIWTLNFLLYAATLNVSSVQFHMTAESTASPWQPTVLDGVAPFVRPMYYGMAAFNQIIGASCTARAAAMDIDSYPSGYNGYVKAYSVYQGERLGSIVVANGKLANVSASDKPTMTVSVTVPTSLAGETVHLSYLTADGADATSGTTWNGLSFEENGDGSQTQVSDDDETTTVGDDGTLSFTVRDTQVVVASFGNKVGADTSSDEDACKAVVSEGLGSTATASAGAKATASSDNDSGAPALGSMSPFVAIALALMTGALLL